MNNLIFHIFVSLVISFNSYTKTLGKTANESCGFPSFIGTNHKHTTVVGIFMKTTFIYALCDPETHIIRYIGKSNNPSNRLKGHIARAKSDSFPYVYAWIRGLLKKGMEPYIYMVDEVPYIEWQFWERHYISIFKSWNLPLTNMAEGGEEVKSTPEQIEARLKKMRKPILQYDKQGNLIKEWESITSATNKFRTLQLSDNKTKILSKGFIFMRKSKNIPIKILPYTSWRKPVLCYDLKGRFIKQFPDRTKASIELNVGYNILCASINTKCRAGNYIFINKRGKIKKKISPAKINTREILQYTREGIFIKEWGSLGEAARFYNVSHSRIGDVTSKRKPTALDYIWRYKKSQSFPFKIKAVPREREKMPSVIKAHKRASITLTGRKIPRDIVQKCRLKLIGRISPRRIPVYQYDMSGSLIKEWEYASLAHMELGIGKKSLYNCLKGRRKEAGGFIWKYNK